MRLLLLNYLPNIGSGVALAADAALLVPTTEEMPTRCP